MEHSRVRGYGKPLASLGEGRPVSSASEFGGGARQRPAQRWKLHDLWSGAWTKRSHVGPYLAKSLKKLERVKGIEPSCAAWEAAVLPLNYTRLEIECSIFPSFSTAIRVRRFSSRFVL
jgi:hypothetical protein